MENKKIKEITYDWSYSHEQGESYFKYKVGEYLSSGKVVKIEEPLFMPEGKYAVDIYFENGKIIRTFNVNSITYE